MAGKKKDSGKTVGSFPGGVKTGKVDGGKEPYKSAPVKIGKQKPKKGC
jgi:hypothetical protein